MTDVKLTWKESIQIPDGKHTGQIMRIESRTEPYEYTDIIIKPDDQDVELKYGCPTVLSENSKLGTLMMAFGSMFEKGKEISISEYLVGKRVQFMTLTKARDGKNFAEIVKDSVKPV